MTQGGASACDCHELQHVLCQLSTLLTFPAMVQQQAGGATAQLRRFILALGECEFAISGVLDELQRDAFTTVADHRPARCTGTALQVRQWVRASSPL